MIGLEKSSRFDFNSIRFRVWGYFVIFSVIMLGLVWTLQTYFLGAFYENMKLRETEKIASALIREFHSEDDITDFYYLLSETVDQSDLYIRVETGDGINLFSPEYSSAPQTSIYGNVAALRLRLLENEFSAYSEVIPGAKGAKTLAYACYLHKATEGADLDNMKNSVMLYIFSPLFPVQSTIVIIKRQLMYITIIALLLAFAMALYLATHISKPINNITKSAAEMGQGNYGVQFNGGPYTEIRELADTLTNASRELEKTDMYQKDLIANVSHDLKTPLTMIKSYAEMIRDLSGDSPVKREQHLGVIIEEADRLNVLVDDMLTMSRMQRRKIELEKHDFDLAGLIESLLSSYDILADKEGYHIQYVNPGPMMVNADEARIKQVVSNLVNNAVKYCGEDKTIIVNVKKVARRVRCEVIDHGQGIAPDEISHVWERYYKSSTHHVRPTEGSGLGLSIVKEILTMHKAKYGVTSKVGKGSTFWFELDQVKEKRIKRQGSS